MGVNLFFSKLNSSHLLIFYILLINFTFSLATKKLEESCAGLNQAMSVSIEVKNCRDTNDLSLCFDVMDILKGSKSF